MKTFKMMRSEYLCWLFNSRIILLPCVFIIVYTMITSDLVKCANNMGAPINLLEPFIGICNSATFLGFIPIVFLVLIADFPRIDNNMIFKIYRAGRIKWVLSQLLFLLAADVTFVFLLFVGITLPILQHGFWFNGWSDVVTDMTRVFPELADSDIAKFIHANHLLSNASLPCCDSFQCFFNIISIFDRYDYASHKNTRARHFRNCNPRSHCNCRIRIGATGTY